jgi:transcriptional regulator with XRE-family HTH domain
MGTSSESSEKDDDAPPKELLIFGVNVRREREAAGLTQLQLAHLANVNIKTVTDVETRGPNITVLTAAKLASALGRSLIDLLMPPGDEGVLAIELPPGDAFVVARIAAAHLQRKIPLIDPVTRRIDQTIDPPLPGDQLRSRRP